MRYLALATCFSATLQLAAQTTWQPLPAPLTFNQFYAVAYDTLRSELNVYDSGTGYSTFNGLQWLSRPTPPVLGLEMAHDPVRDRMVLIGQTLGATQTWGFDGATWGLLATQTPFSQPYGVAWHAQRQTIVALSAQGLHEWNGSIWQAIGTVGTPPSITSPHVSDVFYDGLRNVLVVAQRSGTSIGAVWEWQATTGWSQPVSAPTLGSGVAHFGFDPVRNRQVAIVRRTTSTPFTSDEVWERVPGGAAGWTLRGISPSPTGDGPLAWDAAQARLLLVSWYVAGPMLGYTGAFPAMYYFHGSGCAGSGPLVDELHVTSPAAQPYAGSVFVAEVSSTQSQLGVLVTGLDDQTASGAPLPMSLASLGMGNCLLRVSPDLLTVLTPAGPGTLRSSVLLGPNPAALGLEFFQQALIFKAGVNPFGAVMTNSMRGVKGLP